jgi:hypothetical protein
MNYGCIALAFLIGVVLIIENGNYYLEVEETFSR